MKSTKTILHYQGSVQILIDGFNDDSREIYDIPEVLDFLVKLDREFPCFFFFLEPVPGNLLFMAHCITHRLANQSNDDSSLESFDIKQYIYEHFNAMNQIIKDYHLPHSINGKITKQIVSLFEQSLVQENA